MKQRIPWIDCLKRVGIIFVVFTHLAKIDSLIVSFYSFHMPLFFFCSGYLYNPQKYGKLHVLVISKVQSLIIPYLFFSAVSCPIWSLQGYFGDHQGFDVSLIQPLIGTLRGNGIKGGITHNAALWFLPCLFVTTILFYFRKRIPRDTEHCCLF